MPTLIDSLYVAIGLDPTEYKKGQKEVLDSSKKTKDEAVKSAKAIEEANKKVEESIRKIAAQALALFAVFTGTRSLKDFASQLMDSDAALGRFSKTVGLTPQYLGALESIVSEVGGSADATAGTIAALSRAVTEFRVNGKNLPDEFYRLKADSGVDIPTDRGMVAYIDGLSAALQKLYKSDPQKAALYAQAMNIDSGTLQLMVQYGSQLSKVIDLNKQLAPSDEDIKNAQEFQKAWADFSNTIECLFKNGFREIEPTIKKVVGQMNDWVKANGPWLNQTIDAYATRIAQAFKAIGDSVGPVLNAIKAMDEFNEKSKSFAATPYITGKAFNPNTDENSTPYLGGAITVQKGSVAEKGINWLGSLFGGSSGDLPSTGKATGGPVTGGQAYMVGERGPEPFVPNVSGTIIPNGALGGDLSVDGRPVDRANPVPVTLGNQGQGGENWLQTLGRWLTGGDSAGGAGGGVLGAIGGAAKRVLGSGASGDTRSFTGSTTGKVSGSMGSRAQQLMDRLVKVHGWTPAAAAIAAGNAEQESGIRSDGPMGDPSVPGGSWGMFQWNRARLAALKKFGGANWRDFNVQVDFLAQEAERMVPGWKRQKDLSNAGAIGKAYEGYGDNSTGTRIANARRWLGAYPPNTVPSGVAFTGGARFAAAYQRNSADNRQSSSAVTNVSGPINIHTKATDSVGIAASLKDALHRTLTTSAANYGPG